jgi:hypothetical protein
MPAPRPAPNPPALYEDNLLTLVHDKLSAKPEFFAGVLPHQDSIEGGVVLDSVNEGHFNVLHFS